MKPEKSFVTDRETLNEQLFYTMFSTMPNVPVEKRTANLHLSSFRDRQNKMKKKVKVRRERQREDWLKSHHANKQFSCNKKLLCHKP